MDCEYLATGHYARIIFDANRNRWLLARGDDHAKDQSYMLFNLTQQQLAHILLPLGRYYQTRDPPDERKPRPDNGS